MNKEFYKMQKLAGLITEGQYKEKVNEAEADLLTPDGLHKFLHTLRNSINSDDKKIPLDMVNKAISSIADKLNEIEGDPDDYYGYNEPIDPNDYADGYGDEENQLADIIENNKAALAKQFNLINPTVSWNAEGEPVMMTDDNDEQVDFIKVEDWENNQGFYSRSNTMGEITLDGIDIIYVVNPY